MLSRAAVFLVSGPPLKALGALSFTLRARGGLTRGHPGFSRVGIRHGQKEESVWLRRETLSLARNTAEHAACATSRGVKG